MSLLLLLSSAFGVLATTATPAQAMTSYQYRLMNEAARHKGQPYVYGAAGPTRFDCSGFTLYVFSRFGKRLP
ncbi:MAG: NlpC/P60 family protein, partial [Actinomycetota bacterium]|nr:NlpC/P60 family protein [Actinomycetota bacterium]